MTRSLVALVAAGFVCAIGTLVAETANATTRADAIRRCGNQMGCKVIRERNGDVVIIVDDVDGDGKGGGVIRCPAGTNNCNPMRTQSSTPKKPAQTDARSVVPH
jgi:hypothetical protein